MGFVCPFCPRGGEKGITHVFKMEFFQNKQNILILTSGSHSTFGYVIRQILIN